MSTANRAPRRDATQNRTAILDSARLLLRRDPDASLEAIAAEAGLSRRAVYGHFATRDDLVAEVLTLGAQRIARALGPVEHPDSRVRIALIGIRLWHEVDHVRVVAQLALREPYREQIAAALAPVRRALLESVEAGRSEGTIRTDVAAEVLAHLTESAALAVLAEATRGGMSHTEGRTLVMLNGLAVIGLSWREARELIDATPQLRDPAHDAAAPPDPDATHDADGTPTPDGTPAPDAPHHPDATHDADVRPAPPAPPKASAAPAEPAPPAAHPGAL
ncbi:TetR/AcrR family transcriptional regulator [Compostimonas suwonensis]|uniref:AcrR family transcriptional regulator n=1 Tax=Compostimonas suwonensis TaxID=1048394 RepID=A0A2M9C4K3_9MICO|nr:TetR/AcrR family transcriptional regulator [Compostimonas suwonensis]PJJ65461.1 AcrR family transcriptional regulator [Compostimonas suwonensis]